MSSRIRTVLAIVLAALVAVPAGAAAAGRPAYKNSHLPVRERVADLLSRMTLEEKVGQMTQTERERVFEERDPDHHLEAREHPVRRRIHADGEHSQGLGRHD